MTTDFSIVAFGSAQMRDVMVQAYSHAQTLLRSRPGSGVLIEVRPSLEPISTRQRKFLKDVVFGQISEQVYIGERRERFTKDAWAELYRKRWLGYRYEMRKLPGQKKATPYKIRNSTEELGVRKYREYTDAVIDDAVVELHVEFVFTREEQELRAPPEKRKPWKPATSI